MTIQEAIRTAIGAEIETLRERAAENDGALGGEDLARLFGLVEDLLTMADASGDAEAAELMSAPALSSVYDAAFAIGASRALVELGTYLEALLATPDARAALVDRLDERARLVESLADEAALRRAAARKVPT